MSYQKFLLDKRIIQEKLLNFIDADNDENSLLKLKETLLNQNVLETSEDFKYFLHLLAAISNNHHRTSNFFTNVENILLFLKEHFEKYLTMDDDIFQIFKNNKRIILFLLKENVPIYASKKSADQLYRDYFLPYFIDDDEDFNIFNEKLVQRLKSVPPNKFQENQNIGENELNVCKLIRSDSIEEFIIHINENSLSFDFVIEPTNFETNEFLIENQPTLIEYSAFCGSIQIFQYLLTNKAKLNPELWLYAIHGRNAEIIQLLENNHLNPPKNTFQTCLNESIKCHHNEIAHYVKDTLLANEQSKENKAKADDSQNDGDDKNDENEVAFALKYQNYEFFPDESTSTKNIFYLINYEYFDLAKLFVKSKNINVNLYFNMDSFKKDKNRYTVFATNTFIATEKASGKKYLVYKMKINFSKLNLNEIEVLVDLQYPTLLNLKGYTAGPCFTYFIYDFCTNGTLESYLRLKMRFENKDIDTKDYILILGIAITLKFLHSHNLIHYSLYPTNVFIDENFYPKILGFQMSKKTFMMDIYSKDFFLNKEKVIYMLPPEFNHGQIFVPASNIYSLSYMIYEILTIGKLFNDGKESALYIISNICKGARPNASLIKNHKIAEFLQKCWEANPDSRPSIDDVIEFITGKEFCSYFNPFDNQKVRKFLDIFGDEYDNLKNKF